MTPRGTVLLCAAAVLGATGCWAPPAPTELELERGLVWLLPGINGRPWFKDAYDGLRDGGIDCALEVYDWHGATPLENLQSNEANWQAARELAARIAEYDRAYPGRPIDLVGYSGGGGLAPMIAESLPRSVHLRNVVLVQPALSPGYDLTPCIKHINGRLINFYCETDWLLNGAGTLLFGTIDRKFVRSAGQVGFDLTTALPDESLHDRIDQRKWSLEMMSSGHLGGHLDMGIRSWNKAYVAPLVMGVHPRAASTTR